jgi:hypothetical protein
MRSLMRCRNQWYDVLKLIAMLADNQKIYPQARSVNANAVVELAKMLHDPATSSDT